MCNGRACPPHQRSVITRLNESLRGWFGYFQHSHRTTFPRVDSYVRGRLRAILRKRVGGHAD